MKLQHLKVALFTSMVITTFIVLMCTRWNNDKQDATPKDNVSQKYSAKICLSRLEEKSNMSVEPRVARQKQRNKLILLYTPFFGDTWKNFPTVDPNPVPFVEGHTTFKDCEIPSCDVTYNRSKLCEADAVGFHHRDIHNSLPSRSLPQQIWFYFTNENPLNVAMKNKNYANVFNWTMSYSRNSEVFVPLGKYVSLMREGSAENITDIDITGKDKQVAWLVSNCGGERMHYASELQKYINVSIYGECGDRRACPSKRHSPVCYALLRRHKFYLAFENANCQDYITEKYWENAIDIGIVPIVMGGADYKSLAIPNSYIDVRDFASPRHLADYLLYLDGNNTAYKEYFAWKKRYKRVTSNRACTLCKQLHNQSLITTPRVYKNVADFWNARQCRNLNLVPET